MRDRIRKLLTSRPLRITLLCLGAVLLLGIVTAATLNGIVVGSTKAQILPVEQAAALEDVDCVIVLGAGLRRDGTPSDMLRDRLAVGVALYEAGLQAPYLMSGDNRTDDYNEVGTMQRWAVEHGMSDKVIFLDPYGLCTYDSLWRLSQLDGIDRIVIVTQEYHLYRALYIADTLGFEAYGVDAALNSYFGQSYRDAREILARIKDLLLCQSLPQAERTDALPAISLP
ncbi:MAG: YdcF family protein [Clostridia bacterium]|nr:YdcF family protein [Clostridia bacterium]